MEAALPLDDDRAACLDLAYDAAITGAQIGLAVRDQLDSAADPHACGDPSGE